MEEKNTGSVTHHISRYTGREREKPAGQAPDTSRPLLWRTACQWKQCWLDGSESLANLESNYKVILPILPSLRVSIWSICVATCHQWFYTWHNLDRGIVLGGLGEILQDKELIHSNKVLFLFRCWFICCKTTMASWHRSVMVTSLHESLCFWLAEGECMWVT